MQQQYHLKNLTVRDLSRDLDELWDELQKSDSVLRLRVEQAGIHLTALAGLKRQDVISVKRQAVGLDPATTAVIVSFAPVAAKIVSDLWEHFFLPRLRQERGEDSIREHKEG